MRRLFWMGVGVAATVLVVRWLQKQRRRYGPDAVGAKLAQGSRDLAALVRASVAEGRRAMAEKEAEIRTSLGNGPPR